MSAIHSGMDLRHVRLLVAVDDAGSLTGAAQQMGVTQSALSHLLRDFHRLTGVRLCTRADNRMALSPTARQLLPTARTVLADVDRLSAGLRCALPGAQQTLRISTECYTCYSWLPDALAPFERRHPGVSVQVVLGETHHAKAALAKGKLDVAITNPEALPAGVRYRRLFRDEMVAVVANSHPLASASTIAPKRLAGERLLLYGDLESTYVYQKVFRPLGLRPDNISSLPLTEGLLEMARAGLGVAVLPRWAAGLKSGCSALRIDRRGLFRDWGAATKDGRWSPYLDDFVEYTRRAFQKLNHQK